jgi:hypothetical protein
MSVDIDYDLTGAPQNTGVGSSTWSGLSDKATADLPADNGPLATALSGKQATLVSATNIKTINGQSVLGSGDLTVAGSGSGANLGYTASATNGTVTSAGLVSPAQHAAIAAAGSHASNTSNPHSVTKAQVGLGNVDNTSDATKAASGNAVGDAIAAKYTKPGSGIPSSDLAAAVQTSLGKADTAVQPAGLALVATSGAYGDLSGRPTLGTAAATAATDYATAASGMPAGGTTGQVATKASATDYDVVWQTPSGGGLPAGVTSPGDGALSFASGSLTASRPAIDITQTWNNSAVTFVSRSINITNTASAAASLFDRVLFGGATLYELSKTGKAVFGNQSASFNWRIDPESSSISGYYQSSERGRLTMAGGSGRDITLSTLSTSSGAIILTPASLVEQKNSTTAQTSRVFGTYTDASNGRWLETAVTTGGAASIVAKGNGTGASGNTLTLGGSTVSVDAVLYPKQYTTATRPSFVNGGVIYDTDIDKLVIGGASAWEAVTSV